MTITSNYQGYLFIYLLGGLIFRSWWIIEKKCLSYQFYQWLDIIKLGLIINIPVGDVINIDPCLNIDLLSKKKKIENFPIQIFSIWIFFYIYLYYHL